MRKLLVSDLDGTFLEKNGSVPPNASIFLKTAKDNGFVVVFATARPLGDAKNNIIKYAKPDWLICNDGAIGLKLHNGKFSIVIEHNLPATIAIKNASFFINEGLMPIFFMGSECSFKVFVPQSISLEHERHVQMSDTTRAIEKYASINKVIGSGEIRAVSLYGDIDKCLVHKIKTHNSDDVNIMYYNETRFPGKMWLDIISRKADKFLVSLQIAKIIGTQNIDIALGNGNNDLSLISNASWSSCPSSSADVIKNIVSSQSKEPEGEMFLTEIIQHLELKEWRA